MNTRVPVPPDRLQQLLNPRSIAIVGASTRSAWSHHTVTNLRSGGFTGELHLVSRRGEEIHGQPSHLTLSDVPGSPDLAFVLTGPDSLSSVMIDTAEKGIRNLVVLAAGFAEVGATGTEAQHDLVELARKHDQLILGPNNLGFVNLPDQVVAFGHLAPASLTRGGVGMASQSGALAIYLLPLMVSRDVGISRLVTLGNEAMLSAVDVMEYLLTDDATRVIALYLEQIREPDRFLDLARRARAVGKPVVLFKAGRGESAARVAAAHTGALVGDDRVIDTACRQVGVIRVESIEDLTVTAGLLDAYGELPGRRIGVVTGSGAMCAVIGERVDAVGLELPQLSEETERGLRADGLPAFASVNNPLDTTGYVTVDPSIMPKAQRRVLDDPSVDILLINGDLPRTEAEGETTTTYTAATIELIRTSTKPVVAMSFLPTETSPYGHAWRVKTGFPHVVESFDRGISALARAVEWSLGRRRSGQARTMAPAIPVARPHDSDRWTETRIGRFLAEHGVPVVPSRVTTSANDAVAAATVFGYPVVAKVASPDVAHKTEIGGVVLDLRSERAVRDAFGSITTNVRRAAPYAEVEGVAISPMRYGGIELLVGVIRDPEWGQVLTVGLGGVFVEVLADTAMRLLPVDHAEIRRMLEELSGAALLTGYRGSVPADLHAVADAILAIARLAEGLGDELAEFEVNPLRVAGAQVEALDVLMRWADGSTDVSGRRKRS